MVGSAEPAPASIKIKIAGLRHSYKHIGVTSNTIGHLVVRACVCLCDVEFCGRDEDVLQFVEVVAYDCKKGVLEVSLDRQIESSLSTWKKAVRIRKMRTAFRKKQAVRIG